MWRRPSSRSPECPCTATGLTEAIEPGSCADKAGLVGGSLPLQIVQQEFLPGGDVIGKTDGQALTGFAAGALMRLSCSLALGDTVKVEYFREGGLASVKNTLSERPALPGDIPA